ncbi:MAG TPA: thiamine pyrophosphate-binding protein [Actinomycetota bacterium]|nr:thiamine pyrophosphate-binding protein [Actinomycetota bacterium]
MPKTPADRVPTAGPECASSAAALRQTLEALGVDHIFGMESPSALHAELVHSRIEPVTIRDERSGGFMADAYAKVTGKPGVVGVAGVGATNVVQAFAESYSSSTPVVMFVEEGSGSTRHKNDLQDIDQAAMLAPITKWAGRIEDPARVADITAHAFRVATTGRPGPVYVGCPWDVVSLDPRQVPGLAPSPATYPAGRVAPDPESLERAAELLRSAERPVIVAGGGVLVSRATGELALLAHRLGAPVATTPSGKGAFDEFDPLSAGVAGSFTGGPGGRGRVAHDVIRHADVVFLVGTKTGSAATANWTVPEQRQTIVHLDVDGAEIGRNFPASIPLVADARLGVAALTTVLGDAASPTTWASDLLASTESASPRRAPAGDRYIDADDLFAEIQHAIDETTIVVTDAGYGTVWALDRLRVGPAAGRFITPSGYGTMGYGLPAAIGAKLAAPSSRVVCISGDGGIGFGLGELETAARVGADVTVIVMNNGGLGWSRHYNDHFYGYHGKTEYIDVDYAAVARGLGCDGAKVHTSKDFAEAFADALSSAKPTLIDASIDPAARPPVDMFD